MGWVPWAWMEQAARFILPMALGINRKHTSPLLSRMPAHDENLKGQYVFLFVFHCWQLYCCFSLKTLKMKV